MTSPCTTAEKHNLNCVLKASLELINLPLIDILANNVKEVDLFNKINSCLNLVSGRYRLRTDQLKICHLQPPAIPDYSQFDVTLLYKLIRNLCPTLKPTQGWGKEPKTTDTQLGDDIERLRLFRNKSYAHVNSKGIPNADFKILWKNLKSVINRIQSNGQTVCSVNYEEELIAIENFRFTQGHLENCKLLLQALVNLQTDERDEPVVVIEGKDEVICGDLAQLEAVLKPDSSCWSITWQKRRGKVIQSIDKSKKKYSGSTNRKLVIQSVCKEDEGEYQVLLSHESNGNEYLKCRHTICLRVFGDLPLLNDLEVTTKDEGIIIHYNYEVPSESPEVQCIEWSKDGQLLNTNTCKFVGGRISDSSLTIMLPTEDDKGTYSCKITNAVGFVSKDVLLDVPSVDIELNRTVCFGSKATITAVVVSTPQPEKVIWQKSRDGKKFHGIDITKPNYYGSSDIPFKPMLVIPRATFDDKQFYRLLVRNKIKESISDTVYLNVTGSPPNLSTSHVTNTRNRILKLIGNVSLYDGSPDIQELFWTKNGKKIDTKGSGGRLSEVSNDDISLTIRNVNTEDAGVYQCTAINAVGSTASDVIILGVPEVVFEKPENKEDNSQSYRVTIQSVPSPSFVQWSSKGIGKEIFTPIDVNDEDYKGTLNTLPHPVLVVKKNKLENYDYQIEVANFIGCTVKQISDNEHHPTETKTKENKIYKDRDAGIKFAKLSNYLAKKFPDGELGRLRLMLLASDKVENVSAILSAKSAYDCFTILLKENLFTQNDVILMQFLCKETGCDDLYSECIKYALTNKALCYFEKPPDNGYKNIQFHIQGDLSDYTKEQIKHIVEVVADILDCGTQDIFVNGVKHSNSFFLVLSIKEAFIWKLSEMNEQERFRLMKLHIDFYIIDLNTVFLQSSEGGSPTRINKKDISKVNFPPGRMFGSYPTFMHCNSSKVKKGKHEITIKGIKRIKNPHINRSMKLRQESSNQEPGCSTEIDRIKYKFVTRDDVGDLHTVSDSISQSMPHLTRSKAVPDDIEFFDILSDEDNIKMKTEKPHDTSTRAMVREKIPLVVSTSLPLLSQTFRLSDRYHHPGVELKREGQKVNITKSRKKHLAKTKLRRKQEEAFVTEKEEEKMRNKTSSDQETGCGIDIDQSQEKSFTVDDVTDHHEVSDLKSQSLSPLVRGRVVPTEVESLYNRDDKDNIKMKTENLDLYETIPSYDNTPPHHSSEQMDCHPYYLLDHCYHGVREINYISNSDVKYFELGSNLEIDPELRKTKVVKSPSSSQGFKDDLISFDLRSDSGSDSFDDTFTL